MYKTKIIEKNFKTRERLRQERGLQRQFTTYLMPQGLQTSENLSELEQNSSSTPSQDSYIILQQTHWRGSESLIPCNGEQMVFQQKKQAFQQINAKYKSMLSVDEQDQSWMAFKIKFDLVFGVKSYSQEASVVDINSITQKLQSVRFREETRQVEYD